jgi:hypothetical protein
MQYLKLSLRDLFWLILLAAVSLGWWLEYRRNEPLRLLWLELRSCTHSLPPGALVNDIPPPLDGELTAIDEDKSEVEITLTKDDGLRKGQALYVYRGQRFLGRISVRDADSDGAKCEIDERTQTAKLRPGDRVTTKES